jgi:hypothetical protein
MAHENIPISFRFLEMPVTWEVSVSPKVGTVLCGRLKKWESPEEVGLSELDGWTCRDEFFGLPENDAAKLAEFLDKVGVWSADGESSSLDWSRYPLYAHVDDVWRFRGELRDALLHQKDFMAGVTPNLQRPKTLLDLMAQPHPSNNFPLRFELSKVAAGVVTITNARQMLFATVLADVARGIRFKTCKRKDCGKPFPIESEHTRMFCSQYCGHLVSQRKKRAAEQKRRRARKSLR